MASNNWIGPVATAAQARFDVVMDWLGLSGGKNSGREYLPINPKRDDHQAGSLTIHRDKGAWMEGATGDKGGDLVSLAAYVWDCGQADAAERLGKQLGIVVPDRQKHARSNANGAVGTSTSRAPQKPVSAPKKKPDSVADDGVCLMPVPADAPAAPALHPRHGQPASRWVYVDQSGAVMFHLCRFEPAGERKQFAPLSLWKLPNGALAWKWKAPSAPLPLLGLDRLAVQTGAPVVITEGEKARDAAALLLPDAVAMAWQGGANAVDKADWKPLAGSVVWLWPDADEVGAKAMQKVADQLQAIGADEVRWVNLEALARVASVANGKPALTLGEPLAKGDDAADLVALGWSAAHVALLIEAGQFLVEVPDEDRLLKTEEPPVTSESDTAKDETPRRGFRLDDRGVYFIDVKEGVPAAPRWICTPLEILAQARDPQDCGWGLLVAFQDPDGNHHREIIPARALNGEGLDASGLLLDRGLKIAPKGRPYLMEYLKTASPKKRARVTSRTGWHDAADGATFVLPDRTYGCGSEEWIFTSDTQAGNTYRLKGTLAGWKTEVARRCAGNSRLVFAVSMAFASPLLYLAGAESGGFNLVGNSSGGKTTALRMAASVCGGQDYMQRWRATDNGIEGLALQHCDSLLLLDELAQMDSKVAGEAAYMLANGSGKNRSKQSGGLRAQLSWRLLFLSSGEIGLAQHMADAGKQARAGQELRMADIPADAGAGLGLFENLHECGHGAEFAKALDQASRKNHGCSLGAFLSRLASEEQTAIAEALHEGQRVFEKRFLSSDASGQARRVGNRFALVGAAGELATSWGITGWDAGEAMKAAGVCFQAWLANRGGEGNQEERAILGQVREFLRRYGESAFSDLRRSSMTDTHMSVHSDRAGWREYEEGRDEMNFFVSIEMFRSRVCKGFDSGAVGRLLIAKGFAEQGTEAARPWQIKKKIPGEGRARVVHILPALFEADDA